MNVIKSLRSIFIPLFFLALIFTMGCQKFSDKDFVPGIDPVTADESKIELKSSGVVISDTIQALPDFVLKFWLENLPAGINYKYSWNFGNGSPLLATAQPEQKYKIGVYQLVVAITNPNTGAVITRSAWIRVSLNGPVGTTDKAIIILDFEQVTGGYKYHLGFLASTIYGFVLPPYVSNTPFVTGTFNDWSLTSNSALTPDYTYVGNDLYITKYIIFPNYTLQEIQFGQGVNWSYGINSTYWKVTGTWSGKYLFYPLNGKFYTSSPGVSYIPGGDGDVVNGNYQPTVRDSLMLGVTAATDSLRIFINYSAYASGPKPFISYSSLNVWHNARLRIISSTGWGYYTFSLSSIKADMSRLYFKFGANIDSPTVFGDMTHSKFYDPPTMQCRLQLASLKSSSRMYSITPIN